MYLVQQNKQAQQPKRQTCNKFLSIKSIYRNKKIVTKKTIPLQSFYSRHQNSFSAHNFTSDEVRNQLQGQLTHRRLSSLKQPASSMNPNVITIKFSQNNHFGRSSDHKIRKKGIKFFNLCSDEPKKPLLLIKNNNQSLGSLEQALIVEPLHHIGNQFEFEKKRVYNQYLISSKKSKKEEKSTSLIRRETQMDFKQYGKKITQTEFYRKIKVNSKTKKISTQSLEKKQKSSEKYLIEMHSKTIDYNKDIDPEVIQKQRLRKQQQKQMAEALLKQYKQILPLRKPSQRKDYFVFGLSDKSNEPQNKIQIYRDFLWKINFSNSLYVYTPENMDTSYKAYIGFGNNSCMLKSILRRRSWWTIVQNSSQIESCQFIWTQLKVNSLFKLQPNCIENKIYRDEMESSQNNLPFDYEEDQSIIPHKRILNYRDLENWTEYMKKNAKCQEKLNEQTYVKRLKLYVKKFINKIVDSQKLLVHNHLQFNYFLGNKKALFYNVKRFCQLRNDNPFEYIPVTFHITKGIEDPVYQHFLEYFNKMEEGKSIDKNFKNIWICKPGENTNRGNGISVCVSLDAIKHRLRSKQKNGDGKPRTFILQKYIEKPFLYKNRKFDIRHYMLITCFNGIFKVYWFDEGYIRTSSSIFTLKNANDLMIHLTNDAVQKKGDKYGKHQKGNKVSYEDFQTYLDQTYKKKYDFVGKTLQKMKKIALLAVQATYSQLDPNKKQNNFELIGLDFMIDQNFKPWLIQANTNPCLELSSPLLQKLIPTVVEQTFRICVDPFFPPPQNWVMKNKFFGENALLENKYELIFDQSIDGEKIQQILERNGGYYKQVMGKIQEDNEIFQDDGTEDWEQKSPN